MHAAFKLVRETLGSWSEDNAFRLSAALAYYAAFSLAPLLVIAISIAGFFLGEQAVRGELMSQVGALMGRTGAAAIGKLLEDAATSGAKSTASALGLLSLIFGATGVFVSLQDGLDTVWQVRPRSGNLIIGFLRRRIRTFPVVLGIGFLLLISLLLSAAVAAMGKLFGDRFGPTAVWETVNWLVSLAIVTLLFAMIFKLLPDVHIGWGDVWIGAFFTAVLFTLGKFGIGFYLGRSSFTSVYGAAGSVVLMLAWVYYSSLILFLGAEFTRAYANHFGSRIVPKDGAAPLTPDKRAEEGMQPHKAA